jgi:peroxidase
MAETCAVPPKSCPAKAKYRSYDGSCNNLQNPGWGMPFSRYVRMVRPNYSDGKSAIPLAKNKKPLPNARLLSNKMFPDKEVDDVDFTLINMQWAQLLSHDMSRLAEFTHPGTIKARCCTESGKPIDKSRAHPSCLPIIPPKTEPNYPESFQCINFARSQTDRDRKCAGQRAQVEQLTQVTAFLDLSMVYGNSEAEAKTLRSFKGGRLLTESRLGEEWLPNNKGPNTACDEIVNHTSYLTGDGRANQNPQLTILQVILMREHNGVAGILAKLNPHWNDERLFQEARRINIAMYQHITYNEFLENLLGTKLVTESRRKFPRYDPKVNPSVANEHAGSAFRYFHSSIQGRLE